MERLKRSEVSVELTWNLTDLFAEDAVWLQSLLDIQSDVHTVTVYQGRLGEGASTLLECLDAHERLAERIGLVECYASLKSSEDGKNPENQNNDDTVKAILSEVDEALSFLESEILDLSDGVVERYLQDEPKLADYQNYLTELLSTKPHRLSAETERVMAALGDVHAFPYTLYRRSKASDMQFDPLLDSSGTTHSMSLALYEDVYEQTPETELRRQAYRSLGSTLSQYETTLATAYGAEVKRQVTMARLRGFDSTEAMLLDRQFVTMEMYHNILEVIQTELAPHMRRLAKLRQRLYGLDAMYHCDLKVPLDPEFSPATTYEQACATILDALSVLGPEYREIVQTAMTNRWIDRADNIGKSTGAFCYTPYGGHSFILMTWADTMRSAFVLAHELGHAGHFTLAGRHQRRVNTRPSLYFIEAPSTMNERLLAQHILNNTPDVRMRRWVIAQSLGTYYHNFVTHLLEAELQRRVYTLADQGKPINAKLLREQKGDVLEQFWGDALVVDDTARLTWMRQPHYYMGLYPYTYAAGLTASTAVAQRIDREGQTAVNDWLEVLRAGGTLKPLELMKQAGVDMSKPDPIREAVAYVGSLVDELEKSFE